MYHKAATKISGCAALLGALLAAPAGQAERLPAQPVLGYASEEPPMPADVAQVSVSRDIHRSDPRVKISTRTLQEGEGSLTIRR